jgi:hypothetical protein
MSPRTHSRRAGILPGRVSVAVCSLMGLAGAALADDNAVADGQSRSDTLEEVTVSAQRLQLLGTAQSASEGVVADQELQLTPAYRPAQLLETVPGLTVTSHSGEGKANQYLLRGYNLDHGTDLATFVDGMPINQATHAHGQGYTDLNFMIPELADGLAFTKGPYYASVGDFGSVGSVSLQYRDTIDDQIAVSAGTLDFQRVFGAASQALGDAHLLGALELQHYDGPFDNPDAARKENAVVRYAQGDQHDGYSLTGMFYHQLWNNTTDIPLRAIAEDLVPNRFGALDPTDGGRAQRASFSAQYRRSLGAGQLEANAFFIYNQLHLYNDFTHFLVDPVHGDQEVQFENRRVLGGAASYRLPLSIGALENEILAGLYTRYDLNDLGRTPTQARVPLPGADDPPSFSNHDGVYLYSLAGYLQATTHWTTSLRSVLGLREDFQHGTDVDYLAALHETDGYTNGGTAHKALLQPKASLIYMPWEHLEFYLSAGESFHSTDLRGVNQDKSVNLGLPNAALLSKQNGEEIGMRAQSGRNITATLAIYNLWQQSETVLDPDAGVDSAGPPSRRYGAELNVSYQFTHWLELYGSISANHTRFTQAFDDGTGHVGTYISNAPVAAGSLALYVTDFGPWSAGLEYRYLGNYPLSSGPCNNAAAARDFPDVATSCANAPTAPGQINGRGFGELNLDAHYALRSGWSASVGIYNVLDTHAPAAQFWYVDRLKSEIDTAPDGVADVHEHPLEPLMFRLTIAKRFGG